MKPICSAHRTGISRGWRRTPWGARATSLLLLGLALGLSSCSKAPATTPAAPKGGGGKGGRAIPVTAAPATKADVPLLLNTFGTVQAQASVAIKPQVSELLKTVHIEKGQKLAAGDLLFTLESRAFEVALQQARANLARDRVQAANARVEADRAARLVEQKMAAQTDADTAIATAAALAETVKADEAAIAALQLDLDHCRIYSPISGRAGNLLVHQGNVVKANDVPLVVINQISPIDVFFAIPQRELDRVRTHMAQGELTVEAALPDAPDRPETGRLNFIDNSAATETGTIQLGAVFANAQERLWPGQYVRVRLFLTVQRDATVVPTRAVQTGNDGRYLFVVKADQTVELRPVIAGRSTVEDTVIEKGVQPGEQVVTNGHLQLTDGATVEVRAPGAGADGKAAAGGRSGASDTGGRSGGKRAAGAKSEAAPPPVPAAPKGVVP